MMDHIYRLIQITAVNHNQIVHKTIAKDLKPHNQRYEVTEIRNAQWGVLKRLLESES